MCLPLLSPCPPAGELVLADGSRVHTRAIEPADRDALAEGFARLECAVALPAVPRAQEHAVRARADVPDRGRPRHRTRPWWRSTRPVAGWSASPATRSGRARTLPPTSPSRSPTTGTGAASASALTARVVELRARERHQAPHRDDLWDNAAASALHAPARLPSVGSGDGAARLQARSRGCVIDTPAPCAARGSRRAAGPRSRSGSRRPAAGARRGSGRRRPARVGARAAAVRRAARGPCARTSSPPRSRGRRRPRGRRAARSVSRAPRASHPPGPPGEHGAVPLPRPARRRWSRRRVLMRSSAPGSSSRWQQIHASQRPSARRTIGSLTPVRSSPGNAVRGSAAASPSSVSASSDVDPPVLAVAACAAHVHAPAARLGAYERRALHPSRRSRDSSSAATVVSARRPAERATMVCVVAVVAVAHAVADDVVRPRRQARRTARPPSSPALARGRRRDDGLPSPGSGNVAHVCSSRSQRRQCRAASARRHRADGAALPAPALTARKAGHLLDTGRIFNHSVYQPSR